MGMSLGATTQSHRTLAPGGWALGTGSTRPAVAGMWTNNVAQSLMHPQMPYPQGSVGPGHSSTPGLGTPALGATGVGAPGVGTQGVGPRGREAAAAALQKFTNFEEDRAAGARAARESSLEQERRAAHTTEEGASAAGERNRDSDEKEATSVSANASMPAETGNAASATIDDKGTSEDEKNGAELLSIAGELISKEEFLKEERFMGTLKAYNAAQGFGFIESVPIMKKYGCDVFLNQAVEGGIIIGSTVSFCIQLSKSGKPQARRVFMVAEGNQYTANMPGLAGSVYRGCVKSFNGLHGFGFVTCPELMYTFGGRDVYISKMQVPNGHIAVGQEVEFCLQIDRHGQPQAHDVILLSATKRSSEGRMRGSGHTGWRLFR